MLLSLNRTFIIIIIEMIKGFWVLGFRNAFLLLYPVVEQTIVSVSDSVVILILIL